MNEFLAGIGAITILNIIIFLGICLVSAVINKIDEWKRKYRQKHRFDKPPTAKCYCVDCVSHNNETKQCYRFGQTTKEYRCTADHWFCWEAEPRKE